MEGETKKETLMRNLYMLEPLQREVLDCLLETKTALSVNEIWTFLLNRFYERIHEQIVNLIKEGKIVDKDGILFPSNSIFSRTPVEIYVSKYLPPKNVTLEDICGAMLYFSLAFQSAKNERDILYAKRKFVSQLYQFPSFRTIEEVANSLVLLGYLSTHPSSDKRKKTLYSLNPDFVEAYEEMEKKKQLEKHN